MSEQERALWNRRYQAQVAGEPELRSRVESGDEALGWLSELSAEIPATGRALDVAAGLGRVAHWAARRGLEVTAADISDVALRRSAEAARALGLALHTVEIDLETEPLPRGPWQWISCFRYLQRSLFPALCGELAPGGVLVCEIATVRNLERHARPSARFLLEEGELVRQVEPLRVVYSREGWVGDHCLARVLARRP